MVSIVLNAFFLINVLHATIVKLEKNNFCLFQLWIAVIIFIIFHVKWVSLIKDTIYSEQIKLVNVLLFFFNACLTVGGINCVLRLV